MKIVYMKKGQMKIVAVVLAVLILGVLLWSIIGKDAESTLAEPIYRGDEEGKKAAITINVDWGEDIIGGMLEVLEEKDVKATFFVTGRFAEKYPDIVQTIAENGHEIGNHGYGHPHPDQLSVEGNEEDILKAEEILTKITEVKPKYFAPPYGEHGNNVLQAAENNDYKVVMWTLDTIDWRDSDVDVLVERVSGEKLVPGAIILMHPKSHTLEALPLIIDNLQEKGYTLVGISEIA